VRTQTVEIFYALDHAGDWRVEQEGATVDEDRLYREYARLTGVDTSPMVTVPAAEVARLRADVERGRRALAESAAEEELAERRRLAEQAKADAEADALYAEHARLTGIPA
jgi:hypothetical protein